MSRALSSLVVVCHLLFVACYLSLVGCWSLCVGCWSLHRVPARCRLSLLVVCRSSFFLCVVRCSLFVACCSSRVVRVWVLLVVYGLPIAAACCSLFY